MKKILKLVSIVLLFLLTAKINGQIINTNIEIVKNLVVYEENGIYCAWPMMIQADNGDLLVSFCVAEEHVSPTGKIVLVRSTDKGKTWSKPITLHDTPLDDRGGSLTKLNDGRIIAHLWSVFHPTELFTDRFAKDNSYPLEVLKKWAEYTKTPEYINAKNLQGVYLKISSDNGNTWSKPIPGKDTFHNGIELKDGTLLLAAYNSNSEIILSRTYLKKEPWEWISDTLSLPKYKSYGFAEPQLLLLPNNRIIMLIRTTAANPYDDENYKNLMWETYSDDNGKSWVEPYPLPIWGFPPHLLLLKDGRILCTYGYRRAPYGERACISIDGVTWKHEDEIIMRDDTPNKDLGYPVSLEIELNTILTVYYQPNVPKGTIQKLNPPMPDRKKPGILGTMWKVPLKK
jgi:hypothetical protein